MNRTLCCAVLITLLGVSCGAHGQAGDSKICTVVGQAAASAGQLRDLGKPKAELEKTLPARDIALKTPSGTALYRALDNVYAYPDISPFAHYYYSFSTCLLQSAGQPVPNEFELVHASFASCQKTNGVNASEELGLCLLESIRSAASSSGR